MSNEFQNSSPIADRLLTKEERELFILLKEGPRRRSEIWNHFKEKGISKSTFNRLLNENEEELRIFRIKKGGAVFYRINDFPLNVKTLLVLLDHIIKEKEIASIDVPTKKENEDMTEYISRLAFYYIYQIPKDNQEIIFIKALKKNIVRLFPKLDLQKITKFTIGELNASVSGNQSLSTFIEGLKNVLD